MPEKEEQTIFFIGGAPRSGTTLLHQLICTSGQTNVYHPEISFVVPLVYAYVAGKTNWNNHTFAFFAEKEHLRLHIASMVQSSLAHISVVLKKPNKLTVKSPELTQYFPDVLDLVGKRARFITSVRHPYDIVRSLQEVSERYGRQYGEHLVRDAAQLIVRNYDHLNNPQLAGVTHTIRYEDMDKEDAISDLRKFTGMEDINSGALGAGAAASASSTENTDPWFSPKYHGAIDLNPRLPRLEPAYRAIVSDICGPLMNRFGYSHDT